jgi:hypothetical protein
MTPLVFHGDQKRHIDRTVEGMAAMETSGGRMPEDMATRSVSIQFAEPLEWVSFAYQAVALAQTAVIVSYSPTARSVMFALAAAHAVLAVVVRWGKGPLVLGDRWMVAWLTSGFVVTVVIALLTNPSGYGSSSACLPGCTYTVPPVVLSMFYPWAVVPTLMHRLVGAGLVVLSLEWILLVWLIGGRLTWTAVLGTGSSTLWNVAALVTGLALSRLLGIALADRQGLQQQTREKFIGFLHSHVKAGLVAVAGRQPDVRAMVAKVRELEHTIGDQRIEMLLQSDRIPLAMLLSERIRVFDGMLQFAAVPRVGARTVPQPVGHLIDRALGDLLKNAAVHGGHTASVSCTQEAGNIVVDVVDDGQGFPAGVLEDQSKSLNQLREHARRLGGDLTTHAVRPHGAHLRLLIPDHTDRAGKRRG